MQPATLRLDEGGGADRYCGPQFAQKYPAKVADLQNRLTLHAPILSEIGHPSDLCWWCHLERDLFQNARAPQMALLAVTRCFGEKRALQMVN